MEAIRFRDSFGNRPPFYEKMALLEGQESHRGVKQS